MLATNDAAVLNDIQNGMPGRSRLIGRWDCPIRIAISTTTPTSEKPTTLSAYDRGLCSTSGRTPLRR